MNQEEAIAEAVALGFSVTTVFDGLIRFHVNGVGDYRRLTAHRTAKGWRLRRWGFWPKTA